MKKKIIELIENYLSGKMSWETFGKYFEKLMLDNKSFHEVLSEKIVLILEDIHSDLDYSDYGESLKSKEPYLIYENEFKKRLKRNLNLLKKYI